MVIRTEQMAALSNASSAAFESDMVSHLSRCFPAECQKLRETGVRSLIRHGVEKARSYGITAARDVCRYVDLMMVFGREFDRDPNLPWAASILEGKRWKDPTVKVDQLYRAAKAK